MRHAIVLLTGLCLSACASYPPEGLMKPVAAGPAGVTVPLLVATTRRATPDDLGTLFSGERSRRLSYARIDISIPPSHRIGEIEWPGSWPGDPARNFVTVRADPIERPEFRAAIAKAAPSKRRHVLLFVHGYNNKFTDAVYRFAQIAADSGAPAVPVLFTWPSRGQLLAYPYDRESATYSRDALETVIDDLVASREVGEISILAHSMGNFLALETLRQIAIRRGRLPAKIQQVMLAAPDVDVDVARTQIESWGAHRPKVTLFVSRGDRALLVSRTVWGSTARLGAIDPTVEPFKTALATYHIEAVDLSRINPKDSLGHDVFATAPAVVRAIGNQLATGQAIDTKSGGLGDQIGAIVTGAASVVGSTAATVATAPIAIVDPASREGFGERLGSILPQSGANAEDLAPFGDEPAWQGTAPNTRRVRPRDR